MSKTILISIKPEFSQKIFDGSKKIELRKVRPNATSGDTLLVYSTSPEKAIIGICTIQEVIKSTPASIWDNYHHLLGIDKKRYFEYYEGAGTAIGIVLGQTRKLPKKIPLSVLRKKYPYFSPPQSFRYVPRKPIAFQL